MKQINHPEKNFSFALLLLILASFACSIGGGNDNSANDVTLQQTVVALQATNAALQNQVPPTTPSNDAPIDSPPLPTEEPVEQPDVIYQGVSFSFNPMIAGSVTSSTIPGQNMGDDYMPGDTYPTYVEFSFNTYAVPDHFHWPRIAVYPVEEYQNISSLASDNFDTMQLALLNQYGGGTSSTLPFLPPWNAARFFASNVVYFDFQNGKGVRYLSMFGQAAYPVDNQNLFYTYQGMTNDGQYYISAILPVTHTGLPYDGSSQVADWETFYDTFPSYLDDMVFWLDGQSSGSFTPSLDLLDEMLASFSVNP